MANDYINEIEQVLTQLINNETQEVKRAKIISLIPLLEKEATSLKEKESSLLAYDSIISAYMRHGLTRSSAIAQIHYLDKTIDIYLEQQLLYQQLIKSYQLVNKIRQLFTNQHVSYQIAAGSRKRQILLEANVSFDELTPLLSIQHRSEGYSIRINLTQKNVKNIQQQQKKDQQTIVPQVQHFTQQGSTLYSALYRYFKGEIWNQKGNWGNLYQAYRSLYHKSPTKPKNNWKPSNREMAKALQNSLGGGKEGSFLAGGDNPFEQDKAGYGNPATLTSVQSTSNALLDLSKGLNSFIKTSSTKQLKKILTKNKTGSKVFNQAQQEAREYLDDFFKKLKPQAIISLT